MEKLQRHHIEHHRRQHEATVENRFIRRKVGLIALLPVDIHKDLHDHCPAVPPLDIFTARRVKTIMLNDGIKSNPLDAIDSFSFAVAEAIKSPKSYDVERVVAMQAVEAMRMQIPFIEAVHLDPDPYILDMR